ncbi:beta-galactosidase [Paenibacillus spongiae]|uniref:Beta-galactosidase n=1 Tax=Paenibacillus spongiae TaxID=2909671 RepID=A0ABY5SGH1_9BACL|nr:beta-galactosidase [Paenibacillus spongiae]UVI33086.1 beta-galactosidase [Paenibacillus spongiae]
MKKKASILLTTAIAATLLFGQNASVAEKQTIPPRPDGPVQRMDVSFPIGVFWIQPASQITDESMEEIKDMNVNFLVPHNGTNSFPTHDRVMDFAEAHDLKVMMFDERFNYQFTNKSGPLSEEVLAAPQDIVNHYKGRPGLLGYNIIDEPTGYDSIDNAAQVQELFRSFDPEHMTFVNLTGYWENYNHTGYMKDVNGEYARPDATLGQTFRTQPGEHEITSIQVWLDFNQFKDDEKLTMSIWDSPEKQKLIDSSTLTAESARLFTTFTFDARVKESTDYYWEIIHEGGGDNAVGWIVRSKDGEDWYPQGTGSLNGAALESDFFFFVNSSFYENYVSQWASKNPDMLSFDTYPFSVNGGIEPHTYRTLEIVRRQALKHNLDLWSYMQTVGIDVLREPNEGEMRYNLYTHLAYGVKGIIYFTYGTPPIPGFHDGLLNSNNEKTEKYYYAKQNNAELLQLGETLKQLTSVAVYHTGSTIPDATNRLPAKSAVQPVDSSEPYIISYFEHQNGDPHVMIVNRDYDNAREGTFTFKHKPKWIQEISKISGDAVETAYSLKTGQLTLSFKQGEGILLKLPSNYKLD